MLQPQQVLHQRYQLQKKLGQNAGRQTWLAMDLETQPSESVIVKLLAFNPQMQWEDLKLFEREGQVLKHLSHPRIPQYRDYFSLDKQAGSGLPWFGLVQEYIPGASVQQLLEEGKRFTETQVRQITTEVLEILTYLHALSPPVLHRDIKPSNLIWGEDEKVYLVDFGAVQDQTAAEGVTFTVVGTTGYAPLEQFWGKAVPASDLYALGATLIHLATGTAPADLPQRQMRVQFSDRVSLNSTFIRWIEALTEPELAQRYSSASQALEDLKADRAPSASLPAIRKPKGSRIRLKKSPSRLLIKIPARGASYRNAIKLGTGQILRGLLPIFLALLPIFILRLVLGDLPDAFNSGHPSFFAWLAVTVLLFWLGTIEARILAKVKSQRGQEKLAELGVKMIRKASLVAGFGVVLGAVIFGLLFSILNSSFKAGNPLFFVQLAITVILCWLLTKLPTLVKTASNELIFYLFGHHRIAVDSYKFLIERQLLNICYERHVIATSDIQNIKNIPFKEIAIRTEQERCVFGEELTEPERDWIVQEIYDWLELNQSVVNSSANSCSYTKSPPNR